MCKQNITHEFVDDADQMDDNTLDSTDDDENPDSLFDYDPDPGPEVNRRFFFTPMNVDYWRKKLEILRNEPESNERTRQLDDHQALLGMLLVPGNMTEHYLNTCGDEEKLKIWLHNQCVPAINNIIAETNLLLGNTYNDVIH